MNDTIWSPKMQGQACCKIPYKGYEISIAMDDSCGAMRVYGRSDIRVFRDADGSDSTELLFCSDDTVHATAENLQLAFRMIDLLVQ